MLLAIVLPPPLQWTSARSEPHSGICTAHNSGKAERAESQKRNGHNGFHFSAANQTDNRRGGGIRFEAWGRKRGNIKTIDCAGGNTREEDMPNEKGRVKFADILCEKRPCPLGRAAFDKVFTPVSNGALSFWHGSLAPFGMAYHNFLPRRNLPAVPSA